MILGIAAFLLLGASRAAHYDLNEAGFPPFRAGCGGSPQDWEAVRSIDDPRDGALRTLGVAGDTCMLLPGGPLRDGVLSAWMTAEEGPAGFAARYTGPGDYLAIEVDLAAGSAVAKRHRDGGHQSLGTERFDPIREGRHRVMADLAGDEIRIWVDGRKVYDVAGAPRGEGSVALYADHGALTEFDDIDVVPRDGAGGALFDPMTPAPLPVGKPAGIRLACLDEEAGPAGAPACRYRLSGGSLPPGLSLSRDGRLIGRPLEPGEWPMQVSVRGASGRVSRLPLRIRVSAVAWPRFPPDIASHVARTLAVLYTPDDIGPTITLARLGQPDSLLFRLHRDHPRLKVTLTGCPANRYFGEGRLLSKSPDAARVWRTLALDPAFDWVELGGHGYTHSPDGDVNLDHHEFSITESGCNIDHARLGGAAYCRRRMAAARSELRSAGIPDDRVVTFRFPGMQDSPEALRAAAGAGFPAILGSRHLQEAGREWWVPYPGGEILEIENSPLATVFSRSPALESDLAAGTIAADTLASDPRFRAEVARGLQYVDQIEAQGGILNLFDHWWETFAEVGGAEPRYLALDAVLRDIEGRYGARAWYPHARDLALWLEARRRAAVTWRRADDGLHVTVEPPATWPRPGAAGLQEASLVIGLPAGYTGVSAVSLREGDGPWRDLDRARWWPADGGVAVTFPLSRATELRILPEELPAGSGP